jgi:hypothetical protein
MHYLSDQISSSRDTFLLTLKAYFIIEKKHKMRA